MFAMIRYITVMLACTPLAGFAQPEMPVELDQLIAEALERNPALKAAQYRWDAARHRRHHVSAWDDPMFSYTRWVSTPETRVGPQTNVFLLSQRIPYPGKTGLRGDMVDEEAAAIEAQRHATERDVAFQVKRAYYDLYRIDRSIHILNDYRSVLQRFTRVAEEQYATGTGSQSSVLKSQVEASTVLERRLGFNRARAGIVARINAVRDRAPDTRVGTVTKIDLNRYTIPESSIVHQALTTRQELLEVDARIRRSDLMLRVANLAFRPDFKVQASYITIPKKSSVVSDAGKDAFGIMVGLNIPIHRHRRRAAVDEATATGLAHEMTRQNIANTIRAEIADAYGRMRNTAQTLDLYDQGMMAQAESSLESSVAAYQTGNLDFLNLLDAERTLLQMRLNYIRQQADYRKHVAALEWAAGGELPR